MYSIFTYCKMLYFLVRTYILKIISKRVFDNLFLFIQRNPPQLWGLEQPENFLEKIIILELYKKIITQKYNLLVAKVRPGFKLNHKFFTHNWPLF